MNKKIFAITLIFFTIFSIFVTTVIFSNSHQLSMDLTNKENENNEKPKIINNIKLANSNTSIKIKSYKESIKRHEEENQTIQFYFKDTINNLPIKNLKTSDVKVYNENDVIWEKLEGNYNWILQSDNFWGYILDVNIKGYNAGPYTIKLEVSKKPYYGKSSVSISFNIIGNETKIELKSIKDPSGRHIIEQMYNIRNNFIGSNISVEFDVLDTDFWNRKVLDQNNQSNVFITFRKTDFGNLSKTEDEGILKSTIKYNNNTQSYEGILNTSKFLLGDYVLYLNFSLLNYKNASYNLKLRIIEKLIPEITINKIDQIIAGETASISFRVFYIIDNKRFSFSNASIRMVLYINNDDLLFVKTKTTDENGDVAFSFKVPIITESINFYTEMENTYDHVDASTQSVHIDTISLLEVFLPYVFIILSLVGLIIGFLAIYFYDLVPYNREEELYLSEFKADIKDALNIEYLFVFNKQTKQIIFLKSFKLEQIDPNTIRRLINYLITLIDKDLNQETINQTGFFDKVLLSSLGNLIIVGIILEDPPSISLQGKMKDFIETIEKEHGKILLNSNNKAHLIESLKNIIDKKFKISLIFPYKLNHEISDLKQITNRYETKLINTIDFLIKKSNKKCFTIPSLFKYTIDKKFNNIFKIVKVIKKLIENKVITPLDIYSFKLPPISPNEIVFIDKIISELKNLSEKEKKKLKKELVEFKISIFNKGYDELKYFEDMEQK